MLHRSPQEYFENPAFRSDGLKIYPTLVIRGTGLYELWRTGRYKNYTPNVLVDVVARILALVPPWTRVYRVQRYDPPLAIEIPAMIDRSVVQGHPIATSDQWLRKLGEPARARFATDAGLWG